MSTSSLATDAYKFSMAQAGFPLRRETFYFSLRRGGPQYIPLDLEATIRELVRGLSLALPDVAFARSSGYGFSDAMETALGSADELEICAVPRGCWVLEREPICSITGPSFLVSWLEPMVLWLNFPIQLATALRSGRELEPGALVATCSEHAAIIDQVMRETPGARGRVEVEEEAYRSRVRRMVAALVDAVGSAERIFEVGMRSAVCMEQHRIALSACMEAGVKRTSNLLLARELGMQPVGTMGHEHVQRWGGDLPAFLAMRDMRSAAPSYLLDTFDTMGSGIVAAIEAMRQRPHECSIRYDSGNKFIQYLHACELLRESGLEPAHLLEDTLDLEATRHFESLRAFTGWPAEKQLYGFGGAIVAAPMDTPLTRGRVSAVFKLSETGGQPRMKFGNERGAGKQSVPGRPVVWRRIRGQGPLGIIAQAGEPVVDDYVLLSGNHEAVEQLRLCNVYDLQRAYEGEEIRRTAEPSPETRRRVDAVQRSLERPAD